MTKRILFYVQHLVGVGHVFRATRIVRALIAQGFAVDLVFGGFPVPGLETGGASVHHLPPLKAGEEVFNKLEGPGGVPVDDAYKARRRDMLLAILNATQPDAIVTEAFPFGRRQMRFELVPLIEAARAMTPRPLIVASVRDILQENAKPERDREVVDLVTNLFDRVMIHADPDMVTLGDTFPLAAEIEEKVIYTGLVAPQPSPASPEAFDVVVSVGGGAFGQKLLLAALKAKPLSSLRDARWLALTGLSTTPERLAELRDVADDGITLRSFERDLPSLLAAARLSISRAGYNTVADIYVSGCRAVVIPLSDGIETEQITRASILARSGLAATVSPDDETPEAIAAAIDGAMALPPPDRSRLALDGAAGTARILDRLLRERGEA